MTQSTTSLLALDEPLDREMLEEMRVLCMRLRAQPLFAVIEATLGTPESPLTAGFARPITIPPPRED